MGISNKTDRDPITKADLDALTAAYRLLSEYHATHRGHLGASRHRADTLLSRVASFVGCYYATRGLKMPAILSVGSPGLSERTIR